MEIAGPQRLIIVASQTVTVTGPGATEIEGTMNYEQGPEGRTMYFTLMTTNVPIGSNLGLSCGVQGPQPPIFMPPTKVTVGPSFTAGIVAEVPADFAGPITFFVTFPHGVDGPIGASLRLQVAYPVSSEE